jgi:hypothetical protein
MVPDGAETRPRPGEPGIVGMRSDVQGPKNTMAKFLLWLILLVVCWPLALVALVAYPFVWLLLLPFRLLGIAVEGVFELIRAVILLPARLLRGPRAA